MKTLLTLLLLLTLTQGCSKYVPCEKNETYQPLPGLTINIKDTVDYDVNRISENKNMEVIVTITSTNSNFYRIELWKQMYRSQDKLVEIIIINEPTVKIIKYNPKYDNPFYRIECYASINKKIEQNTIKHNHPALLNAGN